MFGKILNRLTLCALSLVTGLAAQPAIAQSGVGINVGSVSSPRTCQYFREYESTYASAFNAEYRRAWGYRASSRSGATVATWRSWIVKDCQTNFATLRHSLEAALASTGRLTVRPGDYVLDVTISDVSETPPPRRRPVRGSDSYHTSWGTASVNVSYTVRSRNGDTIDGGNIRKKIEMGRTLDTSTLRVRTMEPGEAVYDLMQQEVADTIARSVVMKIDPMKVTAVERYKIEVNYGKPLLKLGSLLQVDKSRGIGAVKYRVISTSNGRAVAEVAGNADTSDIDPGNLVTFVEADSAEANGRVMERVRIP